MLRVVFDLRQAHAAVQELRALSRRESIDLVIANAGVTLTIGEAEEAEEFDAAREVLAVNLDGALATVAGVLPEMRRRGSGQIALVSSLAWGLLWLSVLPPILSERIMRTLGFGA